MTAPGRPKNGRGKDPITALLDEALLGVLREPPDPRPLRRARHLRIGGILILVLASACISGVALLSSATAGVGALVLIVGAILLLLLGGLLIDKAGASEIQAHRVAFSGVIQDALKDEPTVPSPAKIRRSRAFGFGMLALAGFCVCVAAAPLPGKVPFDVLMWAGFSLALVLIGARYIHRSSKEAALADEMLTAVHSLKATKDSPHVGRV